MTFSSRVGVAAGDRHSAARDGAAHMTEISARSEQTVGGTCNNIANGEPTLGSHYCLAGLVLFALEKPRLVARNAHLHRASVSSC